MNPDAKKPSDEQPDSSVEIFEPAKDEVTEPGDDTKVGEPGVKRPWTPPSKNQPPAGAQEDD